jgi:hypothetical protein
MGAAFWLQRVLVSNSMQPRRGSNPLHLNFLKMWDKKVILLAFRSNCFQLSV